MDSSLGYLILSLPQSIDADQWLEQSLLGGRLSIHKLKLPDFQIGTLDSLVEQSEELSKYDSQLTQSVTKVAEILQNVDGSVPKAVQSKPIDSFVESFKWNVQKFRLDRGMKELSDLISSEALSLDNDVKTLYQKYQAAKSNFQASERKRNGDLTIKSLHDIVQADDLVLDSENLTTVLVVVTKNQKQEFESSYETLTQFVVPRSAKVISKDQEYFLCGVTLFKKYEQEFITASREKKWHPRTDFSYSPEDLDRYKKEYELAKASDTKLKSDLLRLAQTAYSDIFSDNIHIKAMKVFVESVLRYGLPPRFDFFLIKFDASSLKSIDKAKKELVEKFEYLGGQGYSNKSNLHDYATLVDADYVPYVLEEVSILQS